MSLIITGANGFIGRAIVKNLINKKNILGVVRTANHDICKEIKKAIIPEIFDETDWGHVLEENGVIIHLAARVHIMKDGVSDPLTEFRRINVEGTLNLARQAAGAGVKRFIFISSIKVNGEHSTPGNPFKTADPPMPVDPYGISKKEAEAGLRKIAEKTGMEVVIIRPPLVYGPGVKANFLSMTRWVQKGVPLPFGSIHNKRTLVALDNLVDLIVTCIDHPAAANQTFLAGDDEDVSTTDLLRKVGVALGKPARLIPVPSFMLKTCAAVLGKGDVADRLLGNLQVDISKAKDLLNWTPPISLDEGIRRACQPLKR